MKLLIAKEKMSESPANFLRRAGYGFLQARGDKQDSFVRRPYSSAFPRLHLYVNDRGDKWEFHLHLDQKPVSYEGSNAHSGEYEGPIVESEIGRLRRELAVEEGQPSKPLPGVGDQTRAINPASVNEKPRASNRSSAEEKLGQGNLADIGVSDKKASFWKRWFS